MFDRRVERAMAERAVGFAVDVEDPKIATGELKSSETLRLEFMAEVKALMNEGLLSEAEFAQLKRW
jgi:hypothetical protein